MHFHILLVLNIPCDVSLFQGGFGTNTSTGFGQSSFGNKPTGTALPAFQSTGFGTTNSLFGNPTTTTSQPAGGLFGAATPSAFGAAQPTTGFGAPTPSTGFGNLLFIVTISLFVNASH